MGLTSQILKTLYEQNKPMKTSEIAKAVNASGQAVHMVLCRVEKSHHVLRTDMYPAEWHITEHGIKNLKFKGEI